MKIHRLKGSGGTYTAHSYLVLGSWNTLQDVNTLVDTGVDGSIISEIERISTGVGKRPVEQVVLTHCHFDHSGGTAAVKRRYGATVLAFAPSEHVDGLLRNGVDIVMGDRTFRVIHAPGHSSDSICLFCEAEHTLFSGDTPVRILTPGGTYSREFLEVLSLLKMLDIRTIYPGHDDPITGDIRGMLERTIENVRSSSTA